MHREAIVRLARRHVRWRRGQRLLVVELLLHQDGLVVHELPHGIEQARILGHGGQVRRQIVDRLDLAHRPVAVALPDVQPPAAPFVVDGGVDDQFENVVGFGTHPADFVVVEHRGQDQKALCIKRVQLSLRQARFH